LAARIAQGGAYLLVQFIRRQHSRHAASVDDERGRYLQPDARGRIRIPPKAVAAAITAAARIA
jgi:hypothetical protein